MAESAGRNGAVRRRNVAEDAIPGCPGPAGGTGGPRGGRLAVSGMKSRVQRGREHMRRLLDECCVFELDHRGTVVGFEARGRCGCEKS